MKIQIDSIKKNYPTRLLQLADPSEKLAYLEQGHVYVATDEGDAVPIAVYVLLELGEGVAEIKNIAVSQHRQGQGIGKKMLDHAAQTAKQMGCQSLLIGTGNSSLGQLGLYQKMGFELDSIKKDYFLQNYAEPIIENGIQCKHMVMLRKPLN